MNKKTFVFRIMFCLSIILFAKFVSFASEPPGSEKVRDIHQQLMERYGLKKQATYNGSHEPVDLRPVDDTAIESSPNRSSGFGSWLQKWGLPVSITIIAVLSVIIYIMFRYVPGVFRSSFSDESWPVQGKKLKAVHVFESSPDEDFEIAKELAKNGQFGDALVVLHKGSVKRLQEKRLIPRRRNLTNNDIRRLVGKTGSNLHAPFSQLASAAERVAFKKENPGEPVFLNFKSLYERVFLKRQRP